MFLVLELQVYTANSCQTLYLSRSSVVAMFGGRHTGKEGAGLGLGWLVRGQVLVQAIYIQLVTSVS